MNYADIKTVDIQDGTGIRVSLYVSGCHFHCKGCHNQEAWDFNYGKKFDDSTIDYILELLDHSYIAGLSLLGGEPMELVNQQELQKLVKRVKEKFPNKTIWCYTGYDFENDIMNDMYGKHDFTKNMLKYIDIMVDGQFIEDKKLVDLKFRGSTNQRKIDVQKSLSEGKLVRLMFGDEERYENKNTNIFKELTLEKPEEKIENIDRIKEKNTTRIIEMQAPKESMVIDIENPEKVAAGKITEGGPEDLN
jgi:anaerobic ribonucleoside-triphosphate reductase activating protein